MNQMVSWVLTLVMLPSSVMMRQQGTSLMRWLSRITTGFAMPRVSMRSVG